MHDNSRQLNRERELLDSQREVWANKQNAAREELGQERNKLHALNLKINEEKLKLTEERRKLEVTEKLLGPKRRSIDAEMAALGEKRAEILALSAAAESQSMQLLQMIKVDKSMGALPPPPPHLSLQNCQQNAEPNKSMASSLAMVSCDH
jgi:hypothetical protein